MRRPPADKTDSSQPAAVATGVGDTPIEKLLGEVTALFHRMRWEAEQLHGQGQMSSGRRGVLRGLRIAGPRTVPQMARARPVSRQYIQTLVNSLAADGLVEFVKNPAHKRSSLVRLTPPGEKLIDNMNRTEQALFEELRGRLPESEINAAAEVVREVREIFESEDWRRLIAG